MSITTPVYVLPRNLRKQVLLDCYNALLERGMNKADAQHEMKHMIICSRLCDLECFIDVRKYRL